MARPSRSLTRPTSWSSCRASSWWRPASISSARAVSATAIILYVLTAVFGNFAFAPAVRVQRAEAAIGTGLLPPTPESPARLDGMAGR